MRLSDVLTRCAAAVRRTAGRLVRMVKHATRAVGHLVGGTATATAAPMKPVPPRRWSRIAMPLLAAACSRADAPTPAPKPVEVATVVAPAPDAQPAPEPPEARTLGEFQLTFYYVASEDEVDPAPRRRAANDNAGDDASLAASQPDLVPVYDRRCRPLASVSRAFAAQLTMQGTGRLLDGRVLNVAAPCDCPRTPCFHVLPSHRKWGMGGSGQPLEPFRTVAVDPRRVKLGSLLYVPELDGVRMPGPAPIGGFVHDGCVVAGDTGGGVQGAQLDLFVARRAYYKGLARRGGSHGWARRVEVLDGAERCQRVGGKVSRSAAGSI